MPAQPEIEGPIPGGGTNRMPTALAEEYGYVEEEYFIGGEATEYATHATAPYRTRVVVRRPADPARADGIAVVEWFNVTAGVDGDPMFGLLNPVILGAGTTYVAVSAQHVAVEGGAGALAIPHAPDGALQSLKETDPDRYGSLVHPGDPYSFDLYAQVATALRTGGLTDGEAPDHVIAMGESQSAYRLVAFINHVQPVTNAYDGFLVHSRGGGAAGLDDEPQPAEGLGKEDAVFIRDDLEVPVLQFETETDLVMLGFHRARQPDTEHLVTWEVAGTAHADASLLEYGAQMRGAEGISIADFIPGLNRGPQREVLRAALVALCRWVTDGVRPPSAPPIESDDGTLLRDADGIAIGGIRTPAVDVPIALHSGQSQSDEILFQLFGHSESFTDDHLRARYPTHADYVDAVTRSADAALAAGHLLTADRDRIVADADGAEVPPT